MGQVAIVTGGSSGIGLACARLLRDRGYAVYELSRNGKGERGISHIPCDVGDEASARTAVQAACSAAGRLDVLILCAGMGISGPVELTESAFARKIFDVNFFGALFCVQAALPYLRGSKGNIVFVSSVAASMAIPFQAFYSCTKAAVNDLALALRMELKPFGVRVCSVMPGDTRTGFTAAREKAADPENIYGGRDARAVAVMERDEERGMSAEAVARTVVRAALAKRPRPFYVAGARYRFLVFAALFVPASLVNLVIRKLYS